ncbi:hypothetical protein [Lentzea kentuckyensis]|uniref:hypothetical protein n=1 Tax=Lentzea kentuckyensis TaxID=360086 RepID=UPI001B80C817|nr:hypothetical protein [Lentzea kentuckyensis]
MGRNINARTVSVALYVLWGLLHMGLGASMVIGDLSDGAPTEEVAAESLLYFIAVTVLGAQAIFVALTLSRVNSLVGFWLNTVVLGVIDVAFVAYLVLPGHVDLYGGLAGPIIWLAATVCAAVALRK